MLIHRGFAFRLCDETESFCHCNRQGCWILPRQVGPCKKEVWAQFVLPQQVREHRIDIPDTVPYLDPCLKPPQLISQYASLMDGLGIVLSAFVQPAR